MKKKSVIIGGSTATIIGLLLYSLTIVSLAQGSTDGNRIDIDCLTEKLKRMCKEGSAPSYLDCENILRCIDGGEQEIMRECVRGYLLLLHLLNETETCNSQDLLYRSWCEYTRGAIPK